MTEAECYRKLYGDLIFYVPHYEGRSALTDNIGYYNHILDNIAWKEGNLQ